MSEDEIRHSDQGHMNLSSMDMQLWGIVYTVALQWNTLVMFHWTMLNVPERRDGLIDFFVPKDATHRYEICEFIEGHLKRLRREATEDGKYGFFPGTQAKIHCTVYTFNGANPEMPAEHNEAMAREYAKRIMQDLGSAKHWDRIKAQALQKAKTDPAFIEKLLSGVLPSRLQELMEEE